MLTDYKNQYGLEDILAFTTGKLKVEGNIDKALRLKQIIDSKKA